MAELNLIFDDLAPVKEVDINAPKLTPKAIDQWFSSIRLTEQQNALEQIFNYLKRANYYDFSISERQYLIEKLHAPVISLVGNLKPKFLNTVMPISKENNLLVDLCINTYQQLIFSYSHILQEYLRSKGKRWLFLKALDTKIALSIQRIVRYLSQIVLTEFEVYRGSNPLIWKKLYQLFSFAEKKNFSNILLLDPLINEKTSVKVTFIQVLLLALSNPYHYNQSQIYYIYKHLANWAKWVDLAVHKSIDPEIYMAINLTDNYMPTFYPRGHKADPDQALFISTHRLSIEKLNQDSDFNNGFLSPKIKSSLIEKLKLAWSVYIDRSFDRNDYYVMLKVVIGLNNVHYVLNNYQQPQWLKKASYSSKPSSIGAADFQQMIASPAFKKSHEHEFDFEDIILTSKIETDLNNQDGISEDRLNNDEIIKTFLTENESFNGMSLLSVNEKSLDLKIGEVIALSHDKRDYPKKWFIGVIKRIQHFKNEPLKVGIQKLCPSGAVPVEVRKNEHSNYQRAILLPEFLLSNESKSLLVGALTQTSKNKIEIYYSAANPDEQANSVIKLVEEIETSPYYMRFKFNLE